MKARYTKYTLQFKRPSGTSRGILTKKDTYFLILETNDKIGIGECGLLEGLSPDPLASYEGVLSTLCQQIENDLFDEANLINDYPSIQMGLDMAKRSLEAETPFTLFPSTFSKGLTALPINGLIWMGDFSFMQAQIDQQLVAGFNCIKMKIGALDFDKELQLLAQIRRHYGSDQIELRVDANGAFHPDTALQKLQELSQFNLHSIEQPIAVGQVEKMHELCQKSPVPIALDEELIGIQHQSDKAALLDQIAPAYIILKPTLLGGFKASQEWIHLAQERGIAWWVTSALESNVGLNAIAQWTATLSTDMPQGLGTGSLYTNNIPCPLVVEKGYLRNENSLSWQFNL